MNVKTIAVILRGFVAFASLRFAPLRPTAMLTVWSVDHSASSAESLPQAVQRLHRAVDLRDSRAFGSFVDPGTPVVVVTNPGVEVRAYLASSLGEVMRLVPHAFVFPRTQAARVRAFPKHSCVEEAPKGPLVVTCSFSEVADMRVDAAVVNPASPRARRVIADLRRLSVEYLYADGVGLAFARKAGRWRLVSIDAIGCDA